ncbi:MAG: SDR family NAD(P)-dependent oxidoreductase [Reyranella sp.]|uniref:SDR family NAD(P)-dependent oxidoreductase n=1 Tax=Reyranella sp. TaxID=1929291 RepID=UPI001AC96FAD|nr:SDR family NAD(P)-dependent oxidoreductase [Reyranella sp.]MBN9085572.1 SDR family NAD(P)-dependent oxidoreductase [Reyranella sp.]
MRIVVIGATSAIAEHCCRLWAVEGADFVLMARDSAKLEKIAADLTVRGAKSVSLATPEFFDPAAIKAFADATLAGGAVDIVLIAHGWMPLGQDALDIASAEQVLQINAVSPVLFAEAFAGPFAQARRGTIAIIGSVAGDVTRRANYIYGGAKSLLTRYAQGLDHRLFGSGVKVVLIKPGPTDTPMTTHMKAAGQRLATPEQVAQITVDAIRRGKTTVYAPGLWRWIMLIVRHLPRPILNRLPI